MVISTTKGFIFPNTTSSQLLPRYRIYKRNQQQKVEPLKTLLTEFVLQILISC